MLQGINAKPLFVRLGEVALADLLSTEQLIKRIHDI
ncbi:MAG: hypothetical protein JWQ25_2344 [Daejeonella sp.]|nr:hypothetical protein [Daejeonella sp.]